MLNGSDNVTEKKKTTEIGRMTFQVCVKSQKKLMRTNRLVEGEQKRIAKKGQVKKINPQQTTLEKKKHQET